MNDRYLDQSSTGNVGLRGVFADLHAEITQPQRVFTVTRYFLEEWVPILRARPAWVTIALRQIRSGNKGQELCTVDYDALAEQCGSSVRSVQRLLADSPDRPSRTQYLSWFVTRNHGHESNKVAGEKTQRQNQYDLLLDEPLTPAHQLALANVIMTTVELEPESVTHIYKQFADDRKRFFLILQDAPETGLEFIPSVMTTRPLTLASSLLNIPPINLPEHLRHNAARLYHALVRPEVTYSTTEYFRLKWLPILKPTLAMLVLQARSRCYFTPDDSVLYDEFEIASSRLAHLTGVTLRQFRNLLADPAIAPFLSVERQGAGKLIVKVRLQDPLTTEDGLRCKQA